MLNTVGVVVISVFVMVASDTTTDYESKRKSVSYNTYLNWTSELDKECNTLTWLDCDTGSRRSVEKLKCKVCVQYRSRIEGSSDKWIFGATSLRTSNIKDHHSRSEQHKHAMMLFKKAQDQSKGISSTVTSTPIAKGLQQISEINSESEV